MRDYSPDANEVRPFFTIKPKWSLLTRHGKSIKTQAMRLLVKKGM